MSELAQLLANGLVTGSIIAIAAIGLTLVYGILGIVNFAHGEYLAFGAFTAFAANVTLGWPIAAAIVVAMGATALLGVGLEYGLWRPRAAAARRWSRSCSSRSGSPWCCATSSSSSGGLRPGGSMLTCSRPTTSAA